MGLVEYGSGSEDVRALVSVARMLAAVRARPRNRRWGLPQRIVRLAPLFAAEQAHAAIRTAEQADIEPHPERRPRQLGSQ
jgi:hypothetical protein